MKKGLRITGIIIVLIILATSVFIWSFASKKTSASNNNKAYAEAMKDKKPSVAMFHSQWCTYCHQMMPTFQDFSEIYKDKYNFVLVDIDAPENKYVVEDYMPAAIPVIYIIDPTINNRVLLNSVLFNYPQKLRDELDRYLRIRAMIK